MKSNPLSMILGTIGVILFISIGFNIIPTKIAIFAGIVCFMLAGLIKRLSR